MMPSTRLPLTAGESEMGKVCTSDNPSEPQQVPKAALSPRRVNTVNQVAYLWVSVSEGTRFHGVQVVYSH